MNYLVRLQEILVGLKSPKIGLVTSIAWQKAQSDFLLFQASFLCFFQFKLHKHIHGFIWKVKKGRGH